MAIDTCNICFEPLNKPGSGGTTVGVSLTGNQITVSHTRCRDMHSKGEISIHDRDNIDRNTLISISNENLVEALSDMLSGWRYIRQVHGDLPGVGWNRAQIKAERALEQAALLAITHEPA